MGRPIDAFTQQCSQFSILSQPARQLANKALQTRPLPLGPRHDSTQDRYDSYLKVEGELGRHYQNELPCRWLRVITTLDGQLVTLYPVLCFPRKYSKLSNEEAWRRHLDDAKDNMTGPIHDRIRTEWDYNRLRQAAENVMEKFGDFENSWQ